MLPSPLAPLSVTKVSVRIAAHFAITAIISRCARANCSHTDSVDLALLPLRWLFLLRRVNVSDMNMSRVDIEPKVLQTVSTFRDPPVRPTPDLDVFIPCSTSAQSSTRPSYTQLCRHSSKLK